MKIKLNTAMLALFLLTSLFVSAMTVEELVNSYEYDFSDGSINITNFVDFMTDTDGNGINDTLIINLTTDATAPATYLFIVSLDEGANLIQNYTNTTVSAASPTAQVRFNTRQLSQSQYNYTVEIRDENHTLVYRKFTITTATYNNYEQGLSILSVSDQEFQGALLLTVDLNVTENRTENITAHLSYNDQTISRTIPWTLTTPTTSVDIFFSPSIIQSTHYNGTYNLESVQVGERILTFPYTTSSYNYEDFAIWGYIKAIESGTADLDANGLADIFSLNLTVVINIPGEYTLSASLADPNQEIVSSPNVTKTFTAGTHIVQLNISGEEVYSTYANGNFTVPSATLSQSNTIRDTILEGHTTEELFFAEFEPPPLPDLAITLNATYTNGIAILDLDLTNQGERPAFNIIIDLFDNETYENQISTEFLQVNESVLTTIIVPNTLPGTPFTAIVDFDNIVDESNEENNIDDSLPNEPPVNSWTDLTFPSNQSHVFGPNCTDLDGDVITISINDSSVLQIGNSLLYQEDADSYGQTRNPGINYALANYTKPPETPYAKWQVKHGFEPSYNISLPDVCFSQSPIEVRLGSIRPQIGFDLSQPQCWNGTGWQNVGSIANDPFGGGENETNCGAAENWRDGNWSTWSRDTSDIPPTCNGLGYLADVEPPNVGAMSAIFEEAMWWAIPNSTLGTLVFIADESKTGIHDLEITCSDGEFNVSQNITLNITGKLPSLTIDLISPAISENVVQNEFFSVATKICCFEADCNGISVSLDPETTRVFFDGFEYAGEPNASWRTYSSTANGYIQSSTYEQHSGSGSLLMDVFTTGLFNLNELITNFSMAGSAYVSIDMWDLDVGDETHNGSDHVGHQNADALYYTCDGSQWYHLHNFEQSNSWENTIINISDDEDWCGIANESFAIKITQYDNYPYAIDSRWFDDITITYTSIDAATKGLIPENTSTPFYTTDENPTIVNLNKDECTDVTWAVNATGAVGGTHTFFAFANLTANPAISNRTADVNITITQPDYGSNCPTRPTTKERIPGGLPGLFPSLEQNCP